MRKEALIFIGEERLEIARIDVVAARGEPPAAFVCEIRPEQRGVPVENHARYFEVASERRRSIGRKQAGHGSRSSGGEPQRANRRGKGYTPQSARFRFAAHLAGATSTAPVSVRPKRSGLYMSSTTACGSM